MNLLHKYGNPYKMSLQYSDCKYRFNHTTVYVWFNIRTELLFSLEHNKLTVRVYYCAIQPPMKPYVAMKQGVATFLMDDWHYMAITLVGSCWCDFPEPRTGY